MAHEPIPYEMVDSFQSRSVSEIREELARKAIDGVLDEVKYATMTKNMELKKRLNQAAECTDCGKPYTFVDGVSYCEDCTTAMTGLSESELVAALSTPPRPLQPGGKVLVEALISSISNGTAKVDMLHISSAGLTSWQVTEGIPLSAIRPFPQEEV